MMGAFNGNPRIESAFDRDRRSPWNNPPINGEADNLVDRFSEIAIRSEPPKDTLFQVMDAVLSAESTIRIQEDENNRLKTKLMRTTQELNKYKLDDSAAQETSADGSLDEHIQGLYNVHFPVSPARNEEGSSTLYPRGTVLFHQNPFPKNEDPVLPTSVEIQHYSENSEVIGTMKVTPGGLAGVDNTGFSHISPSSRPFSPSRYQREEEYDPKVNLSGQGLMQISEMNNPTSLWKQDLVLKVREREEEILQLRQHLADYKIKEIQVHNEKSLLEKRIANMRMAFDQQQQDLVEAASKSISYRQDIVEENIRLTYALQAAQQERSTFLSSLLPLLQEYNLQPAVLDAQSIVGTLKFLFTHLQEKLSVVEARLTESQYQFAPWRSEALNSSVLTPQSPSHSFGAALTKVAVSSHSDHQTVGADWEALGHHSHQNISIGVATKSLDHDILGRSSAAGRNSVQDALAQPIVTQGNFQAFHLGEENSRHPAFSDLVSGNEIDDPEAVGFQNMREPSVHWGSGSPYLTPAHDDLNSSFSPNLPPVLEEPSSSFSEAAEDDPLPAIKDLQITGEAFPGREILACGYSINGTTSCNFEWVRHLENGSVNFIAGAKQPTYLVTADDVDSYLAIEVQPLDDRKRKGELVKVFANEQRKITCDYEMQRQIEKTLSDGQKSFEVLLSAGHLDTWDPAILAIKREGYSIKCNGPRGVVVTEKFSRSTYVEIPYGFPTGFTVHSSSGDEHILLDANNSLLRDTIVLTMRLFIMRVCHFYK
eukprot:TRINITY_DN539_c1_g1_i3.p1 TRINITY_DN539_c1_g1~~TRINITY_DN539_c1_g1_i3.p1  ORF type:complete len:766 (-),score=154.59 TRINITY_DN539_c1_g1_i3:2053-4350(-)